MNAKSGVWMERYEYDGSEGWDIHKYPDLSQLFGDKLALNYERYMKLKRIDN